MITIIGTGHVFDLSKALLNIFEEKEPEIIGVELDSQRYQAIMLRNTDPTAYHAAKKNLPIIYKMLAQFQESMAEQYGVNAGDEMLTAINYAQSHQLPVAFIDTNAQQLFVHMWNTMPFFEKFKLLFSGVAGFFVSKKRVEQELKHYQENFDSYIQEIGKKFPTIKRTLIDERNEYMVSSLSPCMRNIRRSSSASAMGMSQGFPPCCRRNRFLLKRSDYRNCRSRTYKRWMDPLLISPSTTSHSK